MIEFSMHRFKNKRYLLATLGLLSLVSGFGFPYVAQAALETEGTSVSEEASSWPLIKKKLRVRTFSEFMSPGFQGGGPNIPLVDGSAADPTNLFHIFWADYEIAPDTRVVYWQRMNTYFGPKDGSSGLSYRPRNPRFAFRKTNVIPIQNMETTFDLYLQPGIAPESASNGKFLEIGFRTNTSYSFANSRFSVGMISEFTTAYYNQGGDGSSIYGWAMPWVSYELNKTFSTQHYMTFPFQLKRNAAWHDFTWDGQTPFVQNGLGITLSESIWTAVFINNYVHELPSLKNTWASMWLAFTFL